MVVSSNDESNHDELIRIALEASRRAYAPYSRFAVGAALRSKDGVIFTGCNIENGSYGLTVCAERVALFKAVSEGVTEFEAMAVVSDSKEIISPCGACRQVLAEFQPELTVIMSNPRFDKIVMKISDLLPRRFSKP
jgi:cytidine deaminase